MNKVSLFLVSFGLFFSTQSIANSSLPNGRHISVLGHAQVEASPDLAIVTFDVRQLESSSLAAKSAVDKRVNDFLGKLSAFSIDEKNISASNISVEPSYSYIKNKQQLMGYTAKRQLKITLNDVEKLNEMLDTALGAKINQIRNIELKSSQQEVMQDEALQLAVENAKHQGLSLASAFGAKLGAVYSINSIKQHNQFRYGANQNSEHIQVSRNSDTSSKEGQYLQSNIIYSASIHATFDLTIKK